MGDAPEYMNDFKPGSTPVQGQSRADRLKAAGIDAGESLADYQKRQREAAWAASGAQEDAGAEYQRVSSKQGRENVEMPSKDIMEHAQELAKQSGRPISESGLVQEPVTEKSIVGYSDEKKAALAKAKKSSRKGKGD